MPIHESEVPLEKYIEMQFDDNDQALLSVQIHANLCTCIAADWLTSCLFMETRAWVWSFFKTVAAYGS